MRIIYKCTTAANQPTGVMLLAERLWASGVGVELLEGEEVEDKVRELLKVNVAVDWFDVQREDLETLLEYFKKGEGLLHFTSRQKLVGVVDHEGVR